jgi:hypothetical protein
MINDDPTINASFLFPKGNLEDKVKILTLLNDSWAGFYRDNVLPIIPIKQVNQVFCPKKGLPTKKLFILVNLVILQQFFDLSDRLTREALICKIDWHMAMNIGPRNDSNCYVCPQAFWDLRHRLIDKGLDTVIFETVTPIMTEINDSFLDNKRLDSAYLISNMKKIHRLGLFVEAAATFFKALKKGRQTVFDQIDKNLVDLYRLAKFDDNTYFRNLQSDELDDALERAAQDLFSLLKRFEESPEVAKTPGFAQLKRVLADYSPADYGPAISGDSENGASDLFLEPPKEVPATYEK